MSSSTWRRAAVEGAGPASSLGAAPHPPAPLPSTSTPAAPPARSTYQQHVDITVYPWNDDDDDGEDRARPYVQRVPLSSSNQSPSVSRESSDRGRQQRSFQSSSESDRAEASSRGFLRPAVSLLTLAIQDQGQSSQASGSQLLHVHTSVVHVRALQEFSGRPGVSVGGVEVLNDTAYRGDRERPLPAAVYRSGESSEICVHGQSSVHWLLEDAPTGMEQAVPEMAVGKTQRSCPSLNIAAGCLGPGMAVLPVVFSALGLIPSFVIITAISIGSQYSSWLLIRQARQSNGDSCEPLMGQISRNILSKPSQFGVNAAVSLISVSMSLYSFYVIQEVLLADNGGLLTSILTFPLLDSWDGRPLAVDVCVCLIVASTMYRMEWRRASILSSVATYVGAVVAIAFCVVAIVGFWRDTVAAAHWTPCDDSMYWDGTCSSLEEVLFILPYCIFLFCFQHVISTAAAVQGKIPLVLHTDTSRNSSWAHAVWKAVGHSTMGTLILYGVGGFFGSIVMDLDYVRFSSCLRVSGVTISSLEAILGTWTGAVLARYIILGGMLLLCVSSIPLQFWALEQHIRSPSQGSIIGWGRSAVFSGVPNEELTQMLLHHETHALQAFATMSAPVPASRLVLLVICVVANAFLRSASACQWSLVALETIKLIACSSGLLVCFVLPSIFTLKVLHSQRSSSMTFRSRADMGSKSPNRGDQGPSAVSRSSSHRSMSSDWPWASHGMSRSASQGSLSQLSLMHNEDLCRRSGMHTASICLLVLSASLVLIPLVSVIIQFVEMHSSKAEM